jgi:hypothetical protein
MKKLLYLLLSLTILLGIAGCTCKGSPTTYTVPIGGSGTLNLMALTRSLWTRPYPVTALPIATSSRYSAGW